MNEIELKALELKRTAWAVLAGKLPPKHLFYTLYKIERDGGELLNKIVVQLELDNDRWSKSSELPAVGVERDAQGLIEQVSFLSVAGGCGIVYSTDSCNDPSGLVVDGDCLGPLGEVVWKSDHGDRMWLEDFARQMNVEPHRE